MSSPDKVVRSMQEIALRSHAAWASIRLGHDELVDIAKSDSDPLVIEEIMLAEAEGCL